MAEKSPAYELRPANRDEILSLFIEYHGYRSLSSSLTYGFAVIENEKPVAAFAWQPPPPGSAKSVCPEAPHGVLSLSRMVAVPKDHRRLKHISKPLRRQCNHLIDRTRWPVLVTYSDEGQGHNGFVYQCSGWTPTIRSKRPVSETPDGARASCYSGGVTNGRNLVRRGSTWVQRWEQRICEPGEAAAWMKSHGWRRMPIFGKTWTSGKQAYTYININE